MRRRKAARQWFTNTPLLAKPAGKGMFHLVSGELGIQSTHRRLGGGLHQLLKGTELCLHKQLRFMFVALTDKQQLQHFRCAGVCLPASVVCACQPQTVFRVNKADVSDTHLLQKRHCAPT